jgi:superfamily I DNA/RNA helicase
MSIPQPDGTIQWHGEQENKDVDASLNFGGRRTTELKTNYRSTREIGEAAHSYLIT